MALYFKAWGAEGVKNKEHLDLIKQQKEPEVRKIEDNISKLRIIFL